jgi:preprotein translocase subunit SecG
VQIYLNLAMIVVSIALIALIILQSRGAGLGGLSGGDYSGSGYHVRRGLERTMFQATIGLSILFFALSLVSVIILS